MLSKTEVKNTIWVFHGTGAQFSSGVFKNKGLAEESIRVNKLSGVLSEYPIDILCYDYAIEHNYFTPSKPDHFEPKIKQRFSPPLDHYHYEEGEKC